MLRALFLATACGGLLGCSSSNANPEPDSGQTPDAGGEAGASDAGSDGDASIGRAIVSATVPPLATTDPGYADFMTYIAPHINAVAPIFMWNQFDTGTTTGPCNESTCAWSTIDTELVAFIAAGLDINMLIEPTSEGGIGNAATPAYVFSPEYAASLSVAPQDQVVCGGWAGGTGAPIQAGAAHPMNAGVWSYDQCTVFAGTGCANPGPYTDTTGFPVVYETPFLTAYTTFIKTLLTHYSPMGTGQGPMIGSHMGYIRFGMASAAEDIPVCSDVWPAPQGQGTTPHPGFTADAYLAGTSSPPGYVKTVLAAERAANVASGVSRSMVVATRSLSVSDSTFADTEAMLADQYGAGFGMEALSMGDVYNDQNGEPNLCVDDWCNNFDKYASDGLMLYLQTILPNAQPVYALQGIAVSGGMATATCASSNASACNLYPNEPFVLQNTANSAFDNTLFATAMTETGGNVTFAAPTSFPSGTITGGQLYTADYLPVTLPFAVKMHAKALELFSCDLFAAFDPQSLPANVVCSRGYPAPLTNGASAQAYASTIRAISGK